MINNVLVVGASGYVGSQLVPLLAQHGYHVTATGRDRKLLEKRGWQQFDNVNVVQLNLNESVDLSLILADIDVVYFLVHGMSHGHDFVNFELDIAKNFSEQLKKSQVKQVIYLGSLQPAESYSKHFRARKETGELLRSSNVTVTELRAGIIVGAGSAVFEVMRDMVLHLPLMLAPQRINADNSPIALENLLYYLLELIKLSPKSHKIMDVAGPALISYEEQMQIIAQLSGRKLRIIPLARFPATILPHFFKIITSVPTHIASALVGGLQYDLSVDGRELQRLIPQPLLSYEQAVSKTLQHEIDIIDSETWGFDPDALARWQPGYGYYPKQAGYTLTTTLSADALWDQIQLIGTEQGYFFANYLWRIREWIDYAVGGDALQRYRRHPNKLALGDRIDSWKVIGLQENAFLSLLLGMKAPGLGRLEFNIEDRGEYRLLDIRAWWHPAGFSGLVYWYAMMPAHLFIFKGMAKAIAKRSAAVKQPS